MDSGLHAEIEGVLARLKSRHPDLAKRLEESRGYAVFPSMGRAGAVLGASHGKGEVFDQGKVIGSATLSQLTIGVQVGGQTYTEILFFGDKEALERVKSGSISFTANASAALVKAAASGTTDFKGVGATAFSQGGELLEAALGGQKFTFISPQAERQQSEEQARKKEEKEREGKEPGLVSKIAEKLGRD